MHIELNGITKSFFKKQVINNMSIRFKKGETVCFFGPSGCGKTTLLNIISGIIKQDSGTIQGVNDKRISFVFQEDRIIPYVNVYDNIRLVLENNNDKDYILKNLEYVMLKDEHQQFENELSGGMKRRVSIARA